jgi:uncharacterized protein YcfL
MKKYLLLLLLSVIVAACSSSQKKVVLVVDNPMDIDRFNEIVEIQWPSIQQRLSLSDEDQIIVLDSIKQQVLYQILTEGSEQKTKLIFLASVLANGRSSYTVVKGKPHEFPSLVYGRLVPERKDDFAWENNRVAFRIYGPALEATGEISNGMDFWAKSTDSLIIDKWYKNDLAGIASYHEDHGEGLDFYKVGRTLGMGMTAPIDHDTLCLGHNFIKAEILDQGPLRLTFRLSYKPYPVGGKPVNETRVISLDAFSYLNSVTNTFEIDTTTLMIATGIVMPENNPERVSFEPQTGWMAYAAPEDSVNGTIFAGVINPDGFSEVKISQGHLLGLCLYTVGNSYSYYTGGGWSKAGFANMDEWVKYLQMQRSKLINPLRLTIE